MVTQMHAFIIGLAVPLALTGCDLPFDTSGDRVVSILEWVDGPHADRIPSSTTKLASSVASDSDLSAVVSMPDTVQAGVPFEVSVTTIGATSCWKADGAEVEVSSDIADIVPFDLVDKPDDGACADVVVDLARMLSITFRTPGEAIVRVNGRRVVGSEYLDGTSVTVEKRVLVR